MRLRFADILGEKQTSFHSFPMADVDCSRRAAFICLMNHHGFFVGWDLGAYFDYEPKSLLSEILDVHCTHGDNWLPSEDFDLDESDPSLSGADPRDAEGSPAARPEDFGLN